MPVNARVERVDGLSAHADQRELLRWLRGFERPPAQGYVVHGEARSSATLASVISTELGWRASVAEDGSTVTRAVAAVQEGARP